MTVACRHCRGTGLGQLRTWERQTLQVVSATSWTPTREIMLGLKAPSYRMQPTAVINRLNRLVRDGLVKRRPTGIRHGVEWRLTAAGRKAVR